MKDLDKARTHLLARDPILAVVIQQVTLPERKVETNYFQRLVQEIINQQLSNKAADTITTRFVALFPDSNFPTPEQVLLINNEKIRAAGISYPKISYIKDLAEKVHAQQIDLAHIAQLPDEAVITELIKVKGIGQWTAEMFLMFALQRPDVFSYGDLGLRNAMQKLYKLRKHPSPKRAQQISKVWRPYRTVASWYLWESLQL